MRSGISISSSMSPLERPPLRTMLVTSIFAERGSILLSRARLFRSMHSNLDTAGEQSLSLLRFSEDIKPSFSSWFYNIILGG